MNITIKNLDKCEGVHICKNWYVKTARLLAGYYLWDIEDIRTKEVRRIILKRKLNPGGHLEFVHLGEHAHVGTGILFDEVRNMYSLMHKFADELYWAETTYQLKF